MSPAEPDLVLSVGFLPGGDEDLRLKRALKYMLRVCGIRCLRIQDWRDAPLEGVSFCPVCECLTSVPAGQPCSAIPGHGNCPGILHPAFVSDLLDLDRGEAPAPESPRNKEVRP